MARIRKALGDRTSESAQIFAMKSLTASSLDVVTHYAAAVEAQSKGKMEEARQEYLKAVALDSKFGLGYQGLAVMSRNLGHIADANKYIKEALRYLDGMSDRERLGTRGYYDRLIGDNQQCASEYGELLARYPADITAHNQRAGCLQKLRKLGDAVSELEYSVKMLPNYVPLRSNLGLLKDLKGDFEGAEEEFKAISDPDASALLVLAYSQVGRGLLSDAAGTYSRMAATGAKGGSTAASGLADLAIYQGRFADAVKILKEGAAADLASKNPDKAAIKLTTAAYAQLLRGDKATAQTSADEALANSRSMAVRFLAARIFAETGALEKARPLAAELAAELPAEPQAHGKILQGVIALNSGKPREAIDILTGANGVLDTWFGHFELGRAYLAYGALPQADSEFDLTLARRGEALSLMDEGPTYGYFPAVYYYRGRVREALKTAAFAESYRQYLNIRGDSREDPLVPEVRKRTAQ
jgi:Flp pilus assembly protein TadD